MTDHVKRFAWRVEKYNTSNFERYSHAIQDQDFSSKYLLPKKQKTLTGNKNKMRKDQDGRRNMIQWIERSGTA